MILNMYCTEHSLLTIEVYSTEVEACNMIFPPAPLGNQYSLSNVTSYRSFSSDVTAAILVYQNNEMAAILVYGTGISSFLFKYFVLFHHPTGATDHVSENDLLPGSFLLNRKNPGNEVGCVSSRNAMFSSLLERRPGHKLITFCYMVVSEDGDPTQLAMTLG